MSCLEQSHMGFVVLDSHFVLTKRGKNCNLSRGENPEKILRFSCNLLWADFPHLSFRCEAFLCFPEGPLPSPQPGVSHPSALPRAALLPEQAHFNTVTPGSPSPRRARTPPREAILWTACRRDGGVGSQGMAPSKACHTSGSDTAVPGVSGVEYARMTISPGYHYVAMYTVVGAESSCTPPAVATLPTSAPKNPWSAPFLQPPDLPISPRPAGASARRLWRCTRAMVGGRPVRGQQDHRGRSLSSTPTAWSRIG